jgi:hypothetical protein
MLLSSSGLNCVSEDVSAMPEGRKERGHENQVRGKEKEARTVANRKDV